MIISHQISKLVFELTFPSENKAGSGQQQIERLVQEHLTAALEMMLNKYDREAVTTKIDCLEIDLDAIDLSLSDSEIVRQFIQKIELQLDKLFENNETESYTKQIDGQNVTVERQKDEQTQTDIELAIFIIKNGHLPWWTNKNSEFIQLNELVTNLISVNELQFLNAVRKELQFVNFRKRLIQLLSSKQLEWLIISTNKGITFHMDSFSIIRLLQPKKRHEVYERLIIAGLVYEQTDTKSYLNVLYKAARMLDFSMNKLIKAGKNSMSQIDFIHVWTEEVNKQSENDSAIKAKEKQSESDSTSTTITEEQKEKKKERQKEEDKQFQNDGSTKTAKEEKEQDSEAENGSITKRIRNQDNKESRFETNNSISDTAEEKKRNQQTESYLKAKAHSNNPKEVHYPNLMNLDLISEDIIDGIVIQRAGIVLAVPFLSSFFSALGLLKDKKYVDETARHRAVYLLYYLATGSEDIPDEHHLVFEKICCGIDVTDCLLPFQGFSVQEKEESNTLLLSILEAWKALKNSSPNAIREAFLNREGYLKKQVDGTWHIHIERQTIDILIDRIPWTISIMRTPSTNEMLYVEW